jgi:hypothetical protein
MSKEFEDLLRLQDDIDVPRIWKLEVYETFARLSNEKLVQVFRCAALVCAHRILCLDGGELEPATYSMEVLDEGMKKVAELYLESAKIKT